MGGATNGRGFVTGATNGRGFVTGATNGRGFVVERNRKRILSLRPIQRYCRLGGGLLGVSEKAIRAANAKKSSSKLTTIG